MIINLRGEKYERIDIIETAVADSWVAEPLKIRGENITRRGATGRGVGEKRLYIGSNRQEEFDEFFEMGLKEVRENNRATRETEIVCFGFYSDLVRYLKEAEIEYKNPSFLHRADDLSTYYQNALERNEEREREEEGRSIFTISHRTIDGTGRYYIITSGRAGGTNETIFEHMRESVLPRITKISILKLRNIATNEKFLYFKPVLDYDFSPLMHPVSIEREKKKIEQASGNNRERANNLMRARTGQGAYKEKLLSEMPTCLITGVSDERVLDACHIKPWVQCTDKEKVDKNNGITLTPTYHRLLDRGFISFDTDGKLLASPYLSNLNINRLGLKAMKTYSLSQERLEYFIFHREKVFKS